MSIDKYRLDSHKLLYHVDRVHAWLEGKAIYPIYMEISPSGACNHRCTYCGLDFMGYAPRFLEKEILNARLTELGNLGLKSVMYAGEGEPFLHKDMVDIICHTKHAGIDVGITTNGVLLNASVAEQILPFVSWIKVSMNAGTAPTYAAIHRTKEEDFSRAQENMRSAVQLRKKQGVSCTLGIQLVLLPENKNEVKALALWAKEIGIDYLVVKPYSQHPQSITDIYKTINYKDVQTLAEELVEYSSASFSVIVRLHTMKKWDQADRSYTRCLALPFWSYIDAGGNVWGCSMYLRDERFLYGNIYQQSFQEIWHSEKRRQSLEWVATQLDTSCCRINCRMDEVNRYLWDLRHPSEHVNFI